MNDNINVADNTKVAIHRKITFDLTETYKAKNADYGDSFAKIRNEYGPVALMVRLKDKVGRLDSILKSGKIHVKSESIKDTLLDLANYAIMELVEIQLEENEEKREEEMQRGIERD